MICQRMLMIILVLWTDCLVVPCLISPARIQRTYGDLNRLKRQISTRVL